MNAERFKTITENLKRGATLNARDGLDLICEIARLRGVLVALAEYHNLDNPPEIKSAERAREALKDLR